MLEGSSKTYLICGLASFSTFCLGSLSGVWYARTRSEKKYLELFEREREEMREFYAKQHKEGAYATPESTLASMGMAVPYDRDKDPEKELQDLLTENGYVEPAVVQVAETIVNIFNDENFNLEEEIAKRTPDKPYILSAEEFFAAETDFDQVSWTYYEGDDVLAEEDDAVIPDTESAVGNANLLRFGHGSHDNNIVFVRNEKLRLDIEISRSQGDYKKEVLGFLEHSEDHNRRARRFGRDDE